MMWTTDLTGWDDFVEHSNNGTLFHTLKFLDYHEREFNWHHLTYRDGEKLLAVIPATAENDALSSPSGASFGGLVVEPFLSVDVAVEMVQRLQERFEHITITPGLTEYQKYPDEVLDYAYLYCGFEVSDVLYSSLIPKAVRGREDFSKGRRWCVRKAEKNGVFVNSIINKENHQWRVTDTGIIQQGLYGTDVIKDEGFNWIESFYEELLVPTKAKYDTKPVHTVAEMQHIQENFNGRVYLAFKEADLIAGAWVLPMNVTTDLIFYVASDPKYHSLYPVDLLIEQIIADTDKQLDYGVSDDTGVEGMEPAWSLIQFKEHFKSVGALRRTYTWQK